jgi:hypothetical protein
MFKKKNEFGYILIGTSGFEHRVKVEKVLERKLSPDEEVHHINGRKWDNRLSNLALLKKEQHKKWHMFLKNRPDKQYFIPFKTQRKLLIEDYEARLF